MTMAFMDVSGFTHKVRFLTAIDEKSGNNCMTCVFLKSRERPRDGQSRGFFISAKSHRQLDITVDSMIQLSKRK